MNFSRFSAFSAITGSAERKNSLQMRRFQTISEFSHGLGRKATVVIIGRRRLRSANVQPLRTLKEIYILDPKRLCLCINYRHK